MNISNVKTFVWALPNPELLGEKNKHDHSNCIYSRQLDNDQAEISTINFDGRKKSWIVDKCIQDKDIDSNPTKTERKKSITLALKGHNTAFLFFNIGGDFYAYQRRMEEKKHIFEELEKEIKPNTSIEYVYFCVTDRDCYDMRKEVSRSKKSVLERGIDTWMKETNSPMDIWKDISNGTQLPHVLKIKLTDALTKRPGYLYIFDLLHPRFLPLTLEAKTGIAIYNSFEKIRQMVDLVISNDDTYDTYTEFNSEVWTRLLTPFICGFGKLLVLGYLSECPKMHKVETLMALDFIVKMKSIKSKSLPNDETLNAYSIKAIAENEKKYHESLATIQEMKVYINDILSEKGARETYMAELKNKVNKNDSLKEENMELQKRLNRSNQELQLLGQLFKRAAVDVTNRMTQMKMFAYQRMTNLKQEKMKETEALEKLQYENSQLLTKIGLVEDELSREYAIAIKEKNDLRACLKTLRDSVDNTK